MTKIDIFSGFLGAGKTTLIKKLISEAYNGEKLVLIENEFGEIAVDGGFLKDAGVEINEMSSGCICCSLVGDFAEALKKVKTQFSPDRILIEPSGVGKLSDVIKAVEGVGDAELALGSFTTVVDATRAKMYMKNFGEFWLDQVQNAGTIVLSRTAGMSEEKLAAVIAMLREHNTFASIVTTDWAELSGAQLRDVMEKRDTLKAELERLAAEQDDDDDDDDDNDDDEHEHEHGHHHHHHDENGVCSCGHHHGDDDDDDDNDDNDDDDDHGECGHEHGDEGCEEHHHHHHDHECAHEHHHHEHGEECSCGHHHHHGHDADEVFTSWGVETAKKYTRDEISSILAALDSGEYGLAVRSKGFVPSNESKDWIYFDYVPGEHDVRTGGAGVTGRLCVIGSKLREDKLKELFKVG